ncbi:MAG: penicillin-binding protein 1C [Elusimicrobiaceae bacterium]|nr:penicillin-binding protein 1C [Elusimicrobiaceae bacterium]
MKKLLGFVLFFLLPCSWCVGGEDLLLPSKQIYDANGQPIRGFLSNRDTYYFPVTLGEISPWFIAAAVAGEDKRFYQHRGVDILSVLRAGWQNIQKKEVVSGASTLTQQLVRSVQPHHKTMWGKTTEALQALSWEQTHTKEEILEDYFNRLELGNMTQGIQAASQFYFGVDAGDVSLSQAAFLIGLAKSPTRYNPLKHFTRALKRRDYILERMLAENFIDEEMYQLAKEESITVRTPQRPFEAPHFTRFLRPFILPETTYIRTTLDGELQRYAQQLIKTYIAKLNDENVTNAALVVIENSTGAVLAYVGSADFNDVRHQGQVDGVRALRQPGSALKPFVYALAFEKGLLTPASLLEDEDTFFEGGFRPQNYDKSFHGQVSVRQALACSYNIPAVRAAEKMGASSLLDVLHAVGLSELTKPADFYGLGLALGNGEVQLLNLTNAYAVFARGGIYKPLTLSLDPLIQLPGKTKRVFSEQTSYLVSNILADNHARAAAFGLNSALAVPFELAAKTGTSKDYKDNFALAYTPRWTIGVWVGNFDASPMRRVSGVTGAGPIMHDLAIYLQKKYPSDPFKQPEGITQARVCTDSGLLAGKKCPHTREEIFISNRLPSVCDGNHFKEESHPQIISPSTADIYKWDPAVASGLQKMLWTAVCPNKPCIWILNGVKHPQQSCQVWWPLAIGKHQLELMCGSEKTSVRFEVLP